MATIGEILKTAREAKELKQHELAAKIAKITGRGFSREALQQIESGSTKNPKPHNLQAACDALGIDFRKALAGSLHWLSENENYRADENQNTPTQQIESNAEETLTLGKFSLVPVVGNAQLGDNGYWSELEYPVGHGDGCIQYPTRDKNAYALRCKGDSMRPRIKEGEFVIVEPNTEAQNGDEVLVKAKNGKVMVKTLLYQRDGRVHLHSINEAHQPMAIPMQDIEKIHPIAAIVKKALWVKDC